MPAIRLAFLLGLAGCAQVPVRAFDPPRFDDSDLSAELAPEAAQIRMSLSNRSDTPIAVRWAELAMVGPDHRQVALAAPGQPELLAPGARLEVTLSPPIALTAGMRVEVIVPTNVRGVPRDYHFRLRAR